MSMSWFIAGTDTEIGKTFVTSALVHTARRDGHTTLGMKPIAAGGQWVDGQLVNEDAAALQAAGSFDPGLTLLNPLCLESPIAPHIAAEEEGIPIEFSPLLNAYRALRSQADVVFVEGVGGFRVPLGPEVDTADLAVAFGLPVILVVGMRLGCINHALLTAEAIRARGLTLAAWVANQIDPGMLRFDENIRAIEERIGAPLLGRVLHRADGDPQAVDTLRLPV